MAGGKLKEKGTNHWTSPNSGATDEAGFKALPGGLRFPGGAYIGMHLSAAWWSSKDVDNPSEETAFYSTISVQNERILIGVDNKKTGFSVRCVNNNVKN